jgi:tRNA threonylcarbamoyladenosine biosynthesis protein TsaE
MIVKLEEISLFANKLCNNLKIGDVVTINGNLGAGKTTLCKEIIRNLCNDNNLEVASPTFTLLQTYKSDLCTIFHFDLYRLEEPAQIYELGIEDAFNEGISLIEWPEIAQNILPSNIIKINIDFTINDDEREITIS